ncbi:MAG: SAM-dependent chlorinase/fluorinase [Bacteroidetes bacterium]|nr:SAM-dependent chlorinase/fluorinase [Bacteroidota bacterium]
MACITLLSDLGLQDASVGRVKGILAQRLSGVPAIDISHDISPYHLQQAAYLLHSSLHTFAPGTLHIVLVDLFYAQDSRIIVCRCNQQYFIAPDNGILSMALRDDDYEAWIMPAEKRAMHLTEVAHDIAALGAKILSGEDIFGKMEGCSIANPLINWEPKQIGNSLECHIMHIDRFENVILNVTKDQFDAARQNRNFRIEFFMDAVTEINEHYSSVKQGEILGRFNSSGYLEIAINRGKAASLLGLKLNREQNLVYKAIKIIFE